jgi:hypothetical protein
MRCTQSLSLILLAACTGTVGVAPELDGGADRPFPRDAGARHDAGGPRVPDAGGAIDGGEDAAPLALDAGSSDAGARPSEGPGPRLAELTASGPIEAAAGATYAGLRISNPDGPCITIAVPNVRVVDSDLGPCGGGAAIVVGGGASDVVIEHNAIHDSNRGVLVHGAPRVDTLSNTFVDIHGSFPAGTAIEYDYVETGGGTIRGNRLRGTYGSDAISGFQSSYLRIERNDIDVVFSEPSAAAFTLGDSLAPSPPGHDNYAGYNLVNSAGGVPPGIFGSSGHTVLEYNCLRTGLQARTYPPEDPAPFEGVTIRFNRIGPGSFTPAMDLVGEWETNVFTDGSAESCDGLL